MARHFNLSDVVFSISPEPEDIPVSDGGFERADGTPDEELIQKIIDDSEYNEWAWCCVTVTAEWAGFKGEAHLGGCSYESREDFAKGGYLPSMQDEAVAELKAVIKAAGWEFSEEGEVSGVESLSEDEKRYVHEYLFCRSAAKDIVTSIKGPNAFERVTAYLDELREKVA